MEKEPLNKKNNLEYQKITTRFFYASLLNIPIFGVPAFAALFLGKFLDKKFSTGNTIMIIMLSIAFVTSWVVVILNNRRLSRKFKEVRKQMDAERVD